MLTYNGALERIQELASDLSTVHPAFAIAAIAVLPLIGVPIGPLYILAGTAYGVIGGVAVSTAGFTANFLLVYLLGNYICRGPLVRWLKRRGYRVPEVPRDGQWRMCILLRLPGPPLAVQNYLLVLSGIPFNIFMAVSIPMQFVIMLGFVFTGGALFSGKSAWVLLGVSIVIASSILLQLIRKQLKFATLNSGPAGDGASQR